MSKYLKLGEGANTFYDVLTGLHINNKQVVKLLVDTDIKKKSIQAAIKNGHITLSSVDEYNNYQADKKKHLKLSRKLQPKILQTQTVQVNASDDLEDEEDGDGLLNGIGEEELEGESVKDDNTGLLDEGDEGDDDDVTDNVEEMTTSDLIDFLKASPHISSEKKKGLTKLKRPNLINLYNTVKPKE